MIGEDRALRVVPRRAEGDVTVLFQKADPDCEDDEEEDGECAAERISLQTNSHIRPDDDDDDGEEAPFDDAADDEEEEEVKKSRLCPPGLCFTKRRGEDHKHPGAGFGNGMLACLLNNQNHNYNNKTANESGCTLE